MKKKFSAALLAGTMAIGLVAGLGGIVANAAGTAFLVNGVAGATYVAQSTPITQSTTLSSTGAQSASVISLSAQAATVKSVAITGTNPGDFSLSSNCSSGATFTSSATCTFTITFAPQAVGTRTAVLGLTFSAGGGASLNLSGTGLAAPVSPTLSVGTPSISFPNTFTGATAPSAISVTNTGNGPLSLTFALSGANANQFSLGAATCATVAAGATCSQAVSFAPAATGLQSASVTITSNDPAHASVSVPVSGLAQSPAPILSISAGPLTFGSTQVGVQATLPVLVSNAGLSNPLTVSFVVTGVNASEFSLAAPSCSTINVGASCAEAVVFTPASAGAKTAILTVTSNDPANPTTVIQISGTALAPAPVLFIPVNPINFANAEAGIPTAPQTNSLTIFNSGLGAANLTLAITGTQAADFSLGTITCATIAPGSTCRQTISFSPASIGPSSAVLTVTSNDPANASTNILLQGTGIAPFSILSISLGGNIVGTNWVAQPTIVGQSTTLYQDGTAPQPTLVNTGNGADTIVGITPPSTFVLSGPCGVMGGVVPAQGSCPFTITFTPAAGSTVYSGSATLRFASGKLVTVGLSGNGLSVPVPPGPGVLVFSTTSPVFPDMNAGAAKCPTTVTRQGFLTINGTTPQCWFDFFSPSVTFQNTGGSPVTILSSTITGPDAASFRLGTIVTDQPCAVVPVGPSFGVPGTCKTTVNFTPPFAVSGPQNAFLTLTTNDAANPTINIPLTGNALVGPVPIATFNATGFWTSADSATFEMLIVHHANSVSPLLIGNDHLMGLMNDGTNVGLKLADGGWTTQTAYNGNVHQFDLVTGVDSIVGTFTLNMSSNTVGSISYTVNGASFTRTISQLAF